MKRAYCNQKKEEFVEHTFMSNYFNPFCNFRLPTHKAHKGEFFQCILEFGAHVMKQSLSSANNRTSQKMQGHLFWNTPPLLFIFPMIPHLKNKIFWFFTQNNSLGTECRWGALISGTPHSKAIIVCKEPKDFRNKCPYLRVAYLGNAPTLRTLPYTLFVCMPCNFRGESLVVHWLSLKLERRALISLVYVESALQSV
jgi:hypothetical protein